MKDALLTEAEFLAVLRDLVAGYATQKDAAQAWGISPQYLSDVLNNGRAPGEKILQAIGWERVEMYRTAIEYALGRCPMAQKLSKR
jgi:predicted DNA-binding protein (UPF0251 family)